MIDLRALDAAVAELRGNPITCERHDAVVTMLATYGGEAVLPLLLFLAECPNENRNLALRAFTLIGDEATSRVAGYLRSDQRLQASSAMALGAIGTSEAVGALETELKKDAQSARARRRRSKWTLALATLSCAAIAVFAGFAALWGDSLKPCIVLFALVVSAAVGESFANYRPAAIRAIGKSRNGRLAWLVVPFLNGDKQTATSAAHALTELLPLITDADGGYFSPEAIDELVRALAWGDRDFTIATVYALSHVGNDRALTVVENFAQGKWRGKDEAIRKTAEACLPALRARAELARQSLILLRPSVPAGAGGVLLRPAGTADTNVDVLLRATGDRADDGD